MHGAQGRSVIAAFILTCRAVGRAHLFPFERQKEASASSHTQAADLLHHDMPTLRTAFCNAERVREKGVQMLECWAGWLQAKQNERKRRRVTDEDKSVGFRERSARALLFHAQKSEVRVRICTIPNSACFWLLRRRRANSSSQASITKRHHQRLHYSNSNFSGRAAAIF